MRDISTSNFGLLIAYVIPGFTVMVGLGLVFPMVARWLGHPSSQLPTVGGFLYVTIGAVTIGLFLSTLRWLLIDSLHHRTGIDRPNWEFKRFPQAQKMYDALTEYHYRYYQFYGSMVLALPILFGCGIVAGDEHFLSLLGVLGFLCIEAIFFAGSRDTLRKYYDRLQPILGKRSSKA